MLTISPCPVPHDAVLPDRPADLVLAGNQHYEVLAARDPLTIEQALRLRYRVFIQEQGAQAEHGGDTGLDRDRFDDACEHLVVRCLASGEMVGVSRVLLPAPAARLGGYYNDEQFWLNRLDGLRPGLVELGRTCVAIDHRNGVVVRLLWAGMSVLLQGRACRWLIGAVSVSLKAGPQPAAAIWQRLRQSHLAPEQYRVWPRTSIDLGGASSGAGEADAAALPPLFKAYLRMGGEVLGEPHHDGAFNTADFPMMLNMARFDPRMLQRLAIGQRIGQLVS